MCACYIISKIQSKIEKDKRRQERFNFVTALSVGDVLYTSWGYEQTNIDFYQVVRVLNKKIVVREIAKSYQETQFMAGDCVPLPNRFKSDEFMVSMTSAKTAKIKGHNAGLVDFTEAGGIKIFRPLYESHYA